MICCCLNLARDSEQGASFGRVPLSLSDEEKIGIWCLSIPGIWCWTQACVPTCKFYIEDYKPTDYKSRVMADSSERQNTGPALHKFSAIIEDSIVIEEGTLTRFHVKPRTNTRDQSKKYRKITFGQRERDTKKLHKSILMVGETGTGKTKLINTMVNYMLDVKREDKVWFEITDDQSDQTSTHSQTSIITVYQFYLQKSQIDLTIIDTPGYGNTDGIEKDKEIAENFLYLSRSAEGINEIDAVCLVIKATQNRFSDKDLNIFDAVQCLFGRDIAENIVLLLTHSRGAVPKNVLTAVKEDKIKCVVNEQNQPVYFLFDNCQSVTDDETNEMLKQSWDLTLTEIRRFFELLENIKPKTLKMTQNVLEKRKQLMVNVSKIQSHNEMMNPKQNELKKNQDDLEQNRKDVEKNVNFEKEVEVTCKKKVDAKSGPAICCTICEENCQLQCGGWGISRFWPACFGKDDHCTVCTNKCHSKEHVKGAKIYEKGTKKEMRVDEDLKKKCEENIKNIVYYIPLVKTLEKELEELEKEKIKLVIEAFHCVETLQMIALKTDSVFTFQHIDLLIKMLNEINESKKAETLKNIKKRAGEDSTKSSNI